MLTGAKATKEEAVDADAAVQGPQAASGREEHRLTEEAVTKMQQEQQARAETEARCMKQAVERVQGRAKADQGLQTKADGAEARVDAEEPQVEVGTAAEPKGTVASETKAADGCTLDEEGGAQAL